MDKVSEYKKIKNELLLLKLLMTAHGPNTTLAIAHERILDSLIDITCPTCNGKCTIEVEDMSYPTNYPDSGWVTKKQQCSTCNGTGKILSVITV